MKYAAEVIDLLQSYPHRKFKGIEIARYVNPKASGKSMDAIKKGVSRVLSSLEDTGHVKVYKATKRGQHNLYMWHIK